MRRLPVSVPKSILITAMVGTAMIGTAHGAVEAVLVSKAMDESALVVRSNGEEYLLVKGAGCLSLSLSEGKVVYVSSPGLFAGIGSRLRLPDAEQECIIWNSTLVRRQRVSDTTNKTTEMILAIQEALAILGYDVKRSGVLDSKTSEAFEKFRKLKDQDSSESGLRATIVSLAIAVMTTPPVDADRLALGRRLADGLPNRYATSDSCISGHYVASVMDSGRLVKLEDESLWDIDAADAYQTLLWLPVDRVLVCGQSLIKFSNGTQVRAKRLR